MAEKADNVVAASARGATFLILLQIGSRALTFALNQTLLRFLSPELLGAALQLEVFVVTAHHFARESLRVACQRHAPGGGGVQAPVNLSYLAVGGGVLVVLGLAETYLYVEHPQVSFFVPALRMCELAAVVELFSEPAYVVVQQKMLYKVRAAAEASAVVMKTIVTAALVFWSNSRGIDLGVLPFAAGELTYCTVLTIVYLWRTVPVARVQNFSLLPKIIQPSAPADYYFSLFSKPLVNLGASLYVQSGIKYILTRGDTFVSTRFATLADQGMYALSANYGGLIARMLLRPIEDSSQNLFAALCHDRKEVTAVGEKEEKERFTQAASILGTILRFYSIVSMLAVSVGPTAAPLLLRLIAGARWSDSGAGEVLGVYCYYIPLLAINGVSEAFVAAAASAPELRRQSFWMGMFSVGFAVSTWFFLSVLGLGAKGLVFANCVNMSLRILFNLEFASRCFRKHGVDFTLTTLVPNAFTVAVTAVAVSVMATANQRLANYGLLGGLVALGAFGGLHAVFIGLSERRFLLGAFKQIRGR